MKIHSLAAKHEAWNRKQLFIRRASAKPERRHMSYNDYKSDFIVAMIVYCPIIIIIELG